jgi:hypothetical protein
MPFDDRIAADIKESCQPPSNIKTLTVLIFVLWVKFCLIKVKGIKFPLLFPICLAIKILCTDLCFIEVFCPAFLGNTNEATVCSLMSAIWAILFETDNSPVGLLLNCWFLSVVQRLTTSFITATKPPASKTFLHPLTPFKANKRNCLPTNRSNAYPERQFKHGTDNPFTFSRRINLWAFMLEQVNKCWKEVNTLIIPGACFARSLSVHPVPQPCLPD